jgi:protein-S-isoprenylcysteine O-methyltransferase Ste14
MSPMLMIVVGYVTINAVLAVPFTLQARADFQRQGKWSRSTAIFSGLIMHGHFLTTIALAWLDRGSLFAANLISLTMGAALFLGGACVLFLGRYAYGSQQRVYGMLEDKLIRHGIYKRTRNPQYVGYGSMFAGAAIASGSGFALISTLLFMAIIHVFITQVEEPHLKQAFGEDFGQYTKAVPRYF